MSLIDAVVCATRGDDGAGCASCESVYDTFQYQEQQPNPDLYGLLPRSFRYLFSLMNEQPNTIFQLTASFLEIYNEQVELPHSR